MPTGSQPPEPDQPLNLEDIPLGTPSTVTPNAPPLGLPVPVHPAIDLRPAQTFRDGIRARNPTILHSTHFQRVNDTFAARILGLSVAKPLAYRYFLSMVDAYNAVMAIYYHTPLEQCTCPACAVPRHNQYKIRMGNLYVERGGVKVLIIRFLTGNGGEQRSRSHRTAVHRVAINYLSANRMGHVDQENFGNALDLLNELFLTYQQAPSWTPEEHDPCDDAPVPNMPFVRMHGHGVLRVGALALDYTAREINLAADAMYGILDGSGLHLACHVISVNQIPIPVPDNSSVSGGGMVELTSHLPSRVIQLISEVYRHANGTRRSITTLEPNQMPYDPSLLTGSSGVWAQPIGAPPPAMHEVCPNCHRRYVPDRMTSVPLLSLHNSSSRPVVQVVTAARVCNPCVANHTFTCAGCNNVWVGARIVTDTGARLCARCITNGGWNRCAVCGTHTQNRLRGGRCICENCETNSAIVSYSTRADTSPRGGEGPRYFGIELEVVAHGMHRNRVARLVLEWWDGDAICKNDGSLPESGFEIVTSPGTLSWHREKWKGFLGRNRSTSGASHLRSFREQQCGLHIHYSKHSISTLARGRLVAFMNNPNNEPLICAVAGRVRNTYCGTRDSLRLSNAINDTGTDHYSATNLCNQHTDEIRVFKGTLNLKRVLLYLDFTDSMMDYCSQPILSASRGKSFIHYKEFVLANENKWPYLHRYFQHGDAWLKRWAFDADRLLEIPAESVAATDE